MRAESSKTPPYFTGVTLSEAVSPLHAVLALAMLSRLCGHLDAGISRLMARVGRLDWDLVVAAMESLGP